MNATQDIKVPSTRSLTILCLFFGLAFGLMTALSLDSATFFSFVGLAFTLVSIAGALLFASLSRASTHMRIAAESANETVLAEGIGRLTGKQTGVVVAATTTGIASVSSRLVGKPRVSVSIPYKEVLSFEAKGDSLNVKGKSSEIALTRCAPNQVAELAKQLESRAHGSGAY